MSIPTRDELNAEVDRQFRDHFPSAPERLDPDDPAHEGMVKEWVVIRDDVLNDWTNEVFYDFFPEIGRGNKIDPNNPEHAAYIDYWNDIHSQIKEGSSGRYDWSGPPRPAQSESPTVTDLGATDVGVGDPGASGERVIAKGEVSLGRLALRPTVAGDTHVLDVDIRVHELIGAAVPENALWVAITADPYDVETGKDEDNAERRAYLSFNVPAISPRGEYEGMPRLQVDPGHWHVTAELWGGGTTEVIDTAEGDVTVEGHHARDVEFPDNKEVDVSLSITRLERIAPALYRVHFRVTNLSSTQPVPAGLPVTGWLDSGGDALDGSSQTYDFPAPIDAGATTETYLTLEGHTSGTLTATVRIDLEGSSHESDPFEIEADDVPDAPRPQATADPSGQGPATTDPTAVAGPGGSDLPDVNAPDFAEKFKHWAREILVTGGHGSAAIIEIASFWAKAGSRLAMIAEFATPIGYAIALYDIFSAVIDAFGGGLDLEHNRGIVYGLMWDTLDMADIQWTPRQLPGLPEDPFHSDEQRAEAFSEGVREGRAKADDPEVRYNIGMAVAGIMATQKVSKEIAGTLVMNELFKQFGHTRTEVLEFP